ncbi:MAG: VWA domain-containing protein [Gemmobacter sp.]
MLCDLAAGLVLAQGRVTCAGGGPGEVLAALAALLAVGVAAVEWRRGNGLALPGAALFLLAVAALALAASRPEWRRDAPQGEGGLAVVLIDRSESVWRDEGVAQAALARLATGLEQAVAGLPPEVAATWQGQVLRFGRAVTAAPAGPIARLPGVVQGGGAVAPAPESNATAGLQGALDRVRAGGGRGVVYLLGDGHFDPAVPDALLAEARAMGVPVHVMGTGARAPGAGLVAADLGPEQQVGRPAVLRGTVSGGGRLVFSNGTGQSVLEVAPDDALRPARLETVFAARGLRHVRVTFETANGVQERTLYTLVRGPARVLVYGAAPWAGGLDPARWLVTRGDPAAPADAGDFDVVVIDTLSPGDFPPGTDTALLRAAGGTGVLIVNGPMRGARDQPQRIADWNASALSPILPVDSDPRKFIEEPPPRDIVIMIDVSGSMDGPPLAIAKSAAFAVLDQLRPQDTLAILPFSDGPNPPFTRRNADPGAIAAARTFVRGLFAGGGTAPDSTLRQAAGLATNYCAYFFLSDGGFDPPATSPQCFTTAIATAGVRFPQGVADWGEEIILRDERGVGGLTLRYFEPEEREDHFRPGSFVPRAPGGDSALVPPLALDGVAIAFARVDATVAGVHASPPPDPVLAFRRDAARPGIATGVFLTDIAPAWATDPAGQAAVAAMLDELTGWSDLDRYDIRLTQEDTQATVSVVILAGDGPLPATLSGSIVDAAGAVQGLALRPAGEPGRFEGTVDLRLGSDAARAMLVLEEPARATQRIPLSLPAASGTTGGGVTEAFAFGIDRAALARIADGTGGTMLTGAVPRLEPAVAQGQALALHPWLIALALLALAASFWVGGTRP